MHVLIFWASIALMATAFIKVDFPDAFDPVIIVLLSMVTVLQTGSSIKGWYIPFRSSTWSLVKLGVQYLGRLSRNEATDMAISTSPSPMYRSVNSPRLASRPFIIL